MPIYFFRRFGLRSCARASKVLKMDVHFLFEKLRNFSEIVLLPGGVRLKLRYPNFHWRDYRLCLRMKAFGVDPKCIFDVGANEGQFAVGALSAFPKAKLFCYEPGSAAFARLDAELGRNPRVSLSNKALGREEGQATLRVTSSDQSSSFLKLHSNHIEAYPHVKEAREEIVAISTIAKEAAGNLLEMPILLKIDTQGFEFQVLQGSGEHLDQIDWIVFETSTRPMYQGETVFGEISSWLEQRGFTFMGPIEIHVDSTGRPCQFDGLFERRRVRD